MKISVFYNHIVKASEQSGLPLTDVLDKVHAYGIDAVELDLQEALTDTEAMRDRLEAAGISVASMYAFFDFGHDPAPEPGYAFVDTAEVLGAAKVLVIPGFIPEASSPEDRNQALAGMAAALNALCDYAEPKGIQVTMEDFDSIQAPFSSADELLWFLEQVPKLKITFDTGNFIYRGENELEAFAKLKDRIIHVHCKDRSLTDTGGEPMISVSGTPLYPSPVGSGCIKMAEILQLLKTEGYGDTLAIEHFDAVDQLGYMEQSAAWLRGILD